MSTKAPDIKGQVQELTDELLSTSRNNREMLLGLVTSEVDRVVSRMGFVREDELAAVRRHVQRLEKEIADVKASDRKSPSNVAPAKNAGAVKSTAKKPAVKKSVAQKSVAKKAAK